MENTAKKELRYFVAKVSDIQQALTTEQWRQLDVMGEMIDEHRARQGKLPLTCVVVESDWPEYDAVWNSILMRSDNTAPTNFDVNVDRLQKAYDYIDLVNSKKFSDLTWGGMTLQQMGIITVQQQEDYEFTGLTNTTFAYLNNIVVRK